MKCWITLDRYDGTQSKAILVDLGGVSMSDMMFKMMESGVCGFTVTKAEGITRAVRKMEKADDG